MEQVFNTQGLNKEGAVALARHLGLKRDWARVKLSEIQAALRAFPAFKLIDAAQSLPEYFDSEDIEALTDAEAEFDDDTDNDVTDVPVKLEQAWNNERTPAIPAAPKATPTTAKPAATASAPDVTQVAALLAQLLATGKAGLDAAEVQNIVEPMLHHHGDLLLNAVDAKIKGMPAREIVVKSEHATVKLDGLQHRDFETLLQLCGARQPDGHRLNVWLYGPPGTGKTTAAMNTAKALDLPFYCNGALSTKYELIGFKDASGTYQRTPFREAWENGGVYLFDEIDGSDPKAVVAFNSALANGIMSFPDGMVIRHKNAVMIAASNTVHGATSEFTGRMKLDAATVDRFVFLEWEIDEALERAMCPDADWVSYVQGFRARVKAKGVKVHITPRATLYGASLLAQGMPIHTVKRVALRKAMTQEQWKLIEA